MGLDRPQQPQQRGCATCSGVNFGGELFTGTNPYYNPENASELGYSLPRKPGRYRWVTNAVRRPEHGTRCRRLLQTDLTPTATS